ncbi:unnamed protein product [Gongylonema pulchrum]|uniref:PKD_channel domain-containing protein n=1 Tax=Gongylonema pulchrum TaxID=637853 RepID=A0A183D7R7_9BILA|nr:unnamed protein product [Gongylonema pulchrum]
MPFRFRAADLDGRIVLKNQFFTLYWSILRNQSHKIVYNDGDIQTNFALSFNKIGDDGGSYTMVTRGSSKASYLTSLLISLSTLLRPTSDTIPWLNRARNHILPWKCNSKIPIFQEYVNELQSPARLIQGPVYSSFFQRLAPELAYGITVVNSSDISARVLQVDVFTNVRKKPGFTIMMNLHTVIRNENRFYTDVNGMYLMERRYVKSYKKGIADTVTQFMLGTVALFMLDTVA